MAKVMLVIDDYNELLFLETLLKRMGFDVLSLKKDTSLADALIGFFPDLFFAPLKGPLVDGLKAAVRVKKQAPNAKVVLLYPQGTSPQVADDLRSRIDALVESPAQPRETLSIIAQLLKLDAQALIEKFEKLSRARSFGRESGLLVVKEEGPGSPAPASEVKGADSGDSGPSMISAPAGGFGGGVGREAGAPKSARELRYDAFLAKMNEPVDQVIPHAKMVEAVQKLAEASKNDVEELERLEQEKKAFVVALMRDGSKGS